MTQKRLIIYHNQTSLQHLLYEINQNTNILHVINWEDIINLFIYAKTYGFA